MLQENGPRVGTTEAVSLMVEKGRTHQAINCSAGLQKICTQIQVTVQSPTRKIQ